MRLLTPWFSGGAGVPYKNLKVANPQIATFKVTFHTFPSLCHWSSETGSKKLVNQKKTFSESMNRAENDNFRIIHVKKMAHFWPQITIVMRAKRGSFWNASRLDWLQTCSFWTQMEPLVYWWNAKVKLDSSIVITFAKICLNIWRNVSNFWPFAMTNRVLRCVNIKSCENDINVHYVK